MVVYTCITNRKETIRPRIAIVSNCKYVCISDEPFVDENWEHKDLEYSHEDPRRIARWHKVNSHLVFPEEEFVLWIDGNMTSAESPLLLKDELILRGTFLLAAKHRVRSCVYDEFEEVKRLRLDDINVVNAQLSKYLCEGMPARIGLPGTGVLMRRNTSKCKTFNEMWWNEIVHHSKRDQLSFTYVMWKLKYQYSLFENNGRYRPLSHGKPTTCRS